MIRLWRKGELPGRREKQLNVNYRCALVPLPQSRCVCKLISFYLVPNGNILFENTLLKSTRNICNITFTFEVSIFTYNVFLGILEVLQSTQGTQRQEKEGKGQERQKVICRACEHTAHLKFVCFCSYFGTILRIIYLVQKFQCHYFLFAYSSRCVKKELGCALAPSGKFGIINERIPTWPHNSFPRRRKICKKFTPIKHSDKIFLKIRNLVIIVMKLVGLVIRL